LVFKDLLVSFWGERSDIAVKWLATSWTSGVHIPVGALWQDFTLRKPASCPKNTVASFERDKTAWFKSHGVLICILILKIKSRARSLVHCRVFWVLHCVGKVNVPQELAAFLLQGITYFNRRLQSQRFNAATGDALHPAQYPRDIFI
jgi:hypothetical protein